MKIKAWVGTNPDGTPVGGFRFWCPGCAMSHVLRTKPTGWAFNGDHESPTFSPSVLVTWSEWGGTEDPADDIKHCCHSFVTDGRIQFLGDCTHALAGQTVDLPSVMADA